MGFNVFRVNKKGEKRLINCAPIRSAEFADELTNYIHPDAVEYRVVNAETSVVEHVYEVEIR